MFLPSFMVLPSNYKSRWKRKEVIKVISSFIRIQFQIVSNFRYIFYDVNPGEGFNLRRDVFVRVAVMVKKLNEESSKYSYTLVSHIK